MVWFDVNKIKEITYCDFLSLVVGSKVIDDEPHEHIP